MYRLKKTIWNYWTKRIAFYSRQKKCILKVLLNVDADSVFLL